MNYPAIIFQCDASGCDAREHRRAVLKRRSKNQFSVLRSLEAQPPEEWTQFEILDETLDLCPEHKSITVSEAESIAEEHVDEE